MADKCGNCDCADKSQCVKKGNQYGAEIIETHSYMDALVMDVVGAENDGKCNCGASRRCGWCSCD